MDWELIVAIVGVLVGIVAWLRPRAANGGATASATDGSAGPELPLQQLKVSASFGFLTYMNPPRLSDDQMLFVEAANVTPRACRVVAVGLLMNTSSKQLAWIDTESLPPLPCVLYETESVRIWKPLKFIGQALVDAGFTTPLKIRAFVRDSYETKHYSGWIDCDPVDWAKTK